MAFFLFILVNAALFIRPSEIVPAWQGWEIYFYVILACLAAAAPDVLRYWTAQTPDQQPITLCVFGLLIAILIPALLAGDIAEAFRTGVYFAKVVIYYLLCVSLVTTPARLRILLICILAFCGLVTALAVLRFHDLIHLETIQALDDTRTGMWGQESTIRRLQGTGIFHDPNELCVLLSAMIPLCLYFLFTKGNVVLSCASASLIPLFAYAVLLTGSRGGFLALVGGLGALSWAKFGWRKTAVLAALGVPALLIVFAGRQTEVSTSSGTGRTRIELWREWLTTFRDHPLFGKGMTLRNEDESVKRRPDQEKKHVAHNSYLQSFADLGLFGGCLFTGAFLISIWMVYRFNAKDSEILHPDLKSVQPYLLACMGAYGIGMMSLSICFMIPTYLIFALSVVYTKMARQAALRAPMPLRFDLPFLGRLAAAGICTLVGIYVFVRFLA